VNTAQPEMEYERPVCEKCGWMGTPVPIFAAADDYREARDDTPHDGDCVIPSAPLRALRRPDRKAD